MKHLFLAVLTFAAITGGNAQSLTTGNAPRTYVPSVPLTLTAGDIVGRGSKPDDGQTQSISWNTLYTSNFRSLFYYSQSNSTPNVFEYDAPTNSLSIVRTEGNQTGSNISGRIGVMRSTDGINWSYDVLKDLPAGFAAMPNFVQVRNGPNPLAWPVFIYANMYGQTGQASGFYNGFYRNGGSTSETSFSSNVSGQANYRWSETDLAVDNENNGILGLSMLGVVENSSAQYGAYGFFNFILDAEDFNPSHVVAEWYVDKFRAGGGLTSSFNAPPQIDTDSDNRIYVALNNVLVNETERRVLVTTSEDGGTTWSPFNMMPASLYTDLGTRLGQEVVAQVRPYDNGSFIVTAPNKFSYFMTVATGILNPPGNTDGTFTIQGHFICEARYQDGVWSLDTVTSLNAGVSVEGVQLDYPEYNVNTTRPFAVHVSKSLRGFEVEAARTADGGAVLLKYLDEVPGKIIAFNPPIPLTKTVTNSPTPVDADAPLDTLIVTDIFVTYRNTGSTSWSTPNNVTNDMMFNRATFIPQDIPSLTRVPIMQIRAKLFGDTTSAKLPPDLIFAMGDQGGDVQYGEFDATVVGVDDEDARTYAFRINNIVPNPALNLADVTFSLDNGASVSAELFDVLGNKVQTVIAPTFLGAGLHGVSMDVNSLTAGQYYVSVTVGGKRLTRSLVVVK